MRYTKTTSHDVKKTNLFLLASVIVFAFLWCMSFTKLLTPGLWQGFAVLWFCAVLFYGTKFHMTEYVYTLSDDDGFVIVKLMGKKQTKVCHLDIDTVVELYTAEEWKKNKKSRQIVAVYNYNAHALPDEYYVVIFELDLKRSAVMFEGTGEMYEAFRSLIHDSKESQ